MFKRRLLIFLVAVLAALLVAVGRLAHLQLACGEKYADAAARQMLRERDLGAHRGDIVDRDGRILATDQACYEFRIRYKALLLDWAVRRAAALAAAGADEAAARAAVEADLDAAGEASLLNRWFARTGRKRRISAEAARTQLIEGVELTLERAAEIAAVPRALVSENIDAIVPRVQRIRRAVGQMVAEELGSHAVIDALDEAAAVNMRAESAWMTGAAVGPSTRRWYPYADLACHVIGRMGRVTAESLADDPNADDPLLEYKADERLGVTGVERLCEQTLRGSRGTRVMRTTGEMIKTIAPVEGRAVRLTLDIELQRRVTDLLRARPYNGAAVVIDVPTGEILALVSKPTYNLNTYRQDFRRLNSDEENLPLLNRALGRSYPPGSTVKPLTALAALSEGTITPRTVFECRGHADPRRPRCWNRVGHGPLALSEAIMNSCNAYFSRAAERLGAERLGDWMRRFGLGERPGTGLGGEASGFVPSREWMWRRRRRAFFPGDARQMAVGQGAVLATPLQVANVMATIAREGVFLSPVLVAGRADRQVRRELDLSAEALAAVREAMYRVANDPRSQTAYKYIQQRDEVVLCDKTGTAQIRRHPNMAWFAGFAPHKAPTVAFAVVQDYAGGGGANCARLSEKIMIICKELGYIRP